MIDVHSRSGGMCVVMISETHQFRVRPAMLGAQRYDGFFGLRVTVFFLRRDLEALNLLGSGTDVSYAIEHCIFAIDSTIRTFRVPGLSRLLHTQKPSSICLAKGPGMLGIPDRSLDQVHRECRMQTSSSRPGICDTTTCLYTSSKPSSCCHLRRRVLLESATKLDCALTDGDKGGAGDVDVSHLTDDTASVTIAPPFDGTSEGDGV